MGEMSVAEAATTLGVSSRQVERLARTGDVVVTRRVGRSLLLDSSSVHRCAQMGRRRGRPWSEGAAWGALALLSGRSVDWLSSAHRTRLWDRLRRSTADEIAYLARRRQAFILRMRGWGGQMTGPGSMLIAGGVSALDTEPELAARFGLTTGHHESVDGYVHAAHIEAIAETFGLVPDLEGNVTLRVVSNGFPIVGEARGAVPVAAVAVDLMESLSTRERSAGARVLQELLDDLR